MPDLETSLADGRYRLMETIGSGGMATVYRGFDERLQVTRAVKILSEDFSNKPRIRARFEAEARTMAVLDHANIVRVYDVGSEGDTVFIVMELVEGRTLLERIEQGGPVPPTEALQITRAMLDGIRAAHNQGIVHRDIKPHNILLSRDGRVRITDFGIARSIHLTEESFTKTGAVMGTWAFMAPEQRVNSKGVDERADLYGVGATLFAMVTNRTPMDLFASDLDPVMLRDVPEIVLPLIRSATRYQPDERYPDATSMLAVVDSALASIPTAPHTIRSPTPESTAPIVGDQARPLPPAEVTYLPDGAIAMVHPDVHSPSATVPPPPVQGHPEEAAEPVLDVRMDSGTLLPEDEVASVAALDVDRVHRTRMVIGLIAILVMLVIGAVGYVLKGVPPASEARPQVSPDVAAQDAEPTPAADTPDPKQVTPTSPADERAEKIEAEEEEEEEDDKENENKNEEALEAAAEAPVEEEPAATDEAPVSPALKLVPTAPGSGTVGKKLSFTARIPTASSTERKGYSVILSYRVSGERFKRPRTMRFKGGNWHTSFTVTPDMLAGVEWCMFAKPDPVDLPQHTKLTAVSCRSPKRVQIRQP